MPERKNLTTDDAATTADYENGGRGSSFFAKLRVLLFVTIVIVVECAVAYMLLPDASKTRAMAADTLGSREAEESQKQAAEEEISDQIEVDLGEFSVTAFQPLSNTTMRIDFRLFGAIGKEDESEFLGLIDENQHRFREQVIVTVRSAEITDLTDPTLGLIKRKVLERTTKILGKPLLRDVIFSEFSFLEQ